jgi:hypothetical protein
MNMKPDETKTVAEVQTGPTRLRIDYVAWPDGNRGVSLRRFLPGKGVGEEGRWFPSSAGLVIGLKFLPAVLDGLQKASHIASAPGSSSRSRRLERRAAERSLQEPQEAPQAPS